MGATVGRLLAALVLAWAVVLGTAGSTTAHASLSSVTPPDGASLDQPPEQVTLRFTEPPDVGSTATILNPAGGKLAAGVARDGDALTVTLPPLEDGTYTVDWRVISATDGHPTEGLTVFGVGVNAADIIAADVTPQPGPAPAAVAGRILLYAGLLVALGGVAAGLAIYPPGGLPHARWLLAAPLLAAVGLGCLGYAAGAAAAPARLVEVAASNPGRWLAARAIGTLGLVVAGGMAAGTPSRRRLTWMGVFAVGLALGTVASGHAAAPDPTRWAELASQAAHVLAAGVWVGGLGWLLAGLSLPGRAGRVVRFSRLAGASLGVVAATGLWRAIDELGGWTGLWGTGWGRTLLVKVGLVGLLVAGGAFNRWRGVPVVLTGDSRPLARGLRWELVCAIGVVMATGLLATLGPGRPALAAGPPSASGSDYAGTTTLTVTLTGPGQLRASLSGPAADATTLTLRAVPVARPRQPPAVITLSRDAPGRYSGPARALAVPGVWHLDAQVTSPSGVGVTVDDLTLPVLTP